MKYKVKVTVIEKNYIPNCNNSFVQTLMWGLALLIILGTNLFLSVMKVKTVFGIWELTL